MRVIGGFLHVLWFFSHGLTHTVPGAFDTEVTVGLCVFICVPVMGCWHSLQLKLD